jgi:CRP-like cAMP-binding protein
MFQDAVESCTQCPLGTAAAGQCPFHPIRLRAGSVLVAQGEVGAWAYFVKDGLLSLAAADENGAERALGLRGPGAVVGLEALKGRPSQVEVRAFGPAAVCRISGEALSRWLGPPGGPAQAVVGLLLSELERRSLDQERIQGEAVSRVARLALALADSSRSVPKNVAARMLGMRAETFSRCLRQLEAPPALVWGRGVRILDRERLRAVAAGARA